MPSAQVNRVVQFWKSWNRSGGWWHLVGICSGSLSVVGFHLWMQANLNQGEDDDSSNQTLTNTHETEYNTADFLGLLLWLLMFPLAVVAEIQFMAQFHRQRDSLAIIVRIVIQTVSGVLYTAGAIASMYMGAYDPLSCGVVFCIFAKPIGAVENGFKTTVLFLFLLSCLCGLVFVLTLLAIDVKTYRRRRQYELSRGSKPNVHAMKRAISDGTAESDDITSRLTDNDASAFVDDQDHAEYIFPFDFHYTRKQRARCCAITALVCLAGVPALVLLTSLLPNTFEAFHAADIKGRAETCITPDPQNASLCRRIGGPYLCPEYPQALLRSFSVKVNAKVNMKVWADVLIYYGYIYIIIIAGLITHACDCLHRVMHRRIRWPPGRRRLCGSRYYSVGCEACSVGTVFMGVLTSGMLALFTIYWMQSHNFHGNWPRSDMSLLERWARTAGQLAILLMSMLLLPVSRNSIWSFVFGVPWEAAIGTHILLGYGMLATGLVHMFSYWRVFYDQGFFPHDILATPMYFPANGFTAYPNADNFTIPLTTLAFWLTLVCIGVFAQSCIRRKCFELFYYTHHVFLVLFLAVVFHAASAWYFLLGSFVMWLVDRTMRFMNGAHEVVLVSMRPIDDARVTRIEFKIRTLGIRCNDKDKPKALLHSTGQYVFLNVPEISGLQWHPFSLSSAPNDTSNTLHIKDMGPGTFTNELFKLAKSFQQLTTENPGASLAPPTIAVDGPYGLPVEYWRYRQIVLIAGGIGITPVHSTFRGLFYRSNAGHMQKNSTRLIRMLWVVRKPSMLTLFQDTLFEVDQSHADSDALERHSVDIDGDAATECRFDFQLFATRADDGDGHITVQTGAFPNSPPASLPAPDDDATAAPSDSSRLLSSRSQTRSEISLVPLSTSKVSLNSEFGTMTTDSHNNRAMADNSDAGALPMGVDGQDSKIPYRARRPDLDQDLADLRDLGGRVLIFVCGPGPLVSSASAFALKHGYDFHSETFEL